MVATAQRYSELHPEISIHWEKRSLQHFADLPIRQLADKFDLIVLDHPSIGVAAEDGLLLALDEHLTADFLADQAKNSVGASHRSYNFAGHQWALAIDAASPISGWRRDLLEEKGLPIPQTWKELAMAAREGLVVIPGIPIDSLMHFYMVCDGLGEPPFSSADTVVSTDTGVRALEMLRDLYTLVSPQCAHRNPIATWEHLTKTNEVAFCPFAYGYSNYSRASYTEHPLETGGLVAIQPDTPCRSTLGGAGLAISSRCRQIDAAIGYSEFVACPATQRGVYFHSGGQPGHRTAWLDDEVNRISHGFFQNTLATLDAAWLRPRWNGYLRFQDDAGPLVHHHLWNGGPPRDLLASLNDLARHSAKSNSIRSFA